MLVPERWTIIQIPDGYKVFATWAGGYLDGDRWRLNSGIESVTEDEEYYYFEGYSGSVYKCDKRKYGVATHYGHMVLQDIIDKSHNNAVALEDCDWNKFFNG